MTVAERHTSLEEAMSEPKTTEARAAWRVPVFVLLVMLFALGFGLIACTGSSDETTVSSTTASTSVSTTATPTDASSVAPETTSTADSGTVDLGKAEAADSDPALVVETDAYGPGPADQVLVLIAVGKGRPEAEAVASQLGGTIVGEVEYIQLYQIRTSGTAAEDLVSAIQAAGAFPGVEAAFPNAIMVADAAIEGQKCSALRDPLYDGNNAIPYDMVGAQEAWDVIRASGVTLNDVHLGQVDTAVYTESGQGFGTELEVTGLSPADTTDQPDPEAAKQGGLSHGTRTAHVMAADAENGGVTGILGPFTDKVTMSTGNWSAGPDLTVAQNPDPNDATQYQGYFLKTLVEMKKQVDVGATVINPSFGPARVGAQNAWEVAAYRRFFEQMQRDHPKVLFVAAAGNDAAALDGSNSGPGGMKFPNLITVGALDQTGDRATVTDWYSTEQLQQFYDAAKAAGTVPDGQTLEQYVSTLASGSRTATGDGEVTLSACGTGVPTGVDADGRPVVSNGTSFAAPQVAAAAALLKTINPDLDAEAIKKILVDSADVEVEQADGSKVAVPAGVGGKVLRIDKAVLAGINQLRPPDDQLKMEDLLALATVKLVAEGCAGEYTITASISRVGSGGTDLTISMTGEGSIDGNTSQYLSAPGEVSWTVTPKEGNTPLIKVHRSDTKACARLTLEGSPFAGTYKGSIPVTLIAGTPDQVPWEFTVDGEGNVKGGWKYAPSADLSWSATFSGQVSEEGRLTASGPAAITATVGGETQGKSGTLTLTGDISGAEFVGTATVEGSMEVTATRQ